MIKHYIRMALIVSILAVPLRALPQQPIEIHQRLLPQENGAKRVALTLDACSGQYDGELIQFLIQNRIPATIFATKKWLDHNPLGVSTLLAHLDLFDVEDHGENHVPAVIGRGRKVYGIPGEPDLMHLRREVTAGGKAIEQAIGVAPHWYRGATAEYDPQAIEEIGKLGYKIAGFSVNADAGATLKRTEIEARLKHVKSGDMIIAHMNRPASDSAEGLAVALADLLHAGFIFVRLDQVRLEEIPVSGGGIRNDTPPSLPMQ